MQKIAVTGHKGRLGSELVRRGCIPLDVDITDERLVSLAIKSVEPDVIINCAAVRNEFTTQTEYRNAEAVKVAVVVRQARAEQTVCGV